jgi:hypothetical protein
VHSFGTPSITPCSVVPPGCPALSSTLVVIAIGPADGVPIGQGDSFGTVRSVRGSVGVVVRFGVRTLGSDFEVELPGRTLGGLHNHGSALWASYIPRVVCAVVWLARC